MAIKRLDPTATFKIICDLDDSLLRETQEELAVILETKGSTRHEAYLEDLDESKLTFVEGAKPNRFVIRCHRNDEWSEMQARHMELDSISKTFRIKDNPRYLFDLFEKGCIGMENDDGTVEKVTHNEIGMGVVVSVGAAIAVFTVGGRNLKKR